MSQWSTPSSGPLATRERAENESKARKNREPVVHFVEWTTSSPEKGSNLAKSYEKSRARAPLAA